VSGSLIKYTDFVGGRRGTSGLGIVSMQSTTVLLTQVTFSSQGRIIDFNGCPASGYHIFSIIFFISVHFFFRIFHFVFLYIFVFPRFFCFQFFFSSFLVLVGLFSIQ
jgi:hypothetical protein